jgi:sarcosine oxidase subunit beta
MGGLAIDRADAVVIGAGILGLSTGFHLLRRRPSLRVHVVERAPVAGAGSTGKATGGIRHQFASPVLVRLSVLSAGEYREFQDLTGADAEFDQVGYLLFATSERTANGLRDMAAVLRGCDVPVEELGAGEVARRWPYLNVDDVRGATHTPGDGHASPHAAVTGYLRALRNRGGRVSFETQAVDITVRGDQVTGVRTDRGRIEAPVVVNAAGVHAAGILQSLGLVLPVRPYRRQVAVLTPVALGVDRAPFTMEVDSGWYFHRLHDGTVLLGGIDKDSHPGMDEVEDPRVTERLLEIAIRRVQGFASAGLLRTYTGLRALTPDDLPVLGPVPTHRGLFCACGFAGHGFMHAPAVGRLLAQWILDGRPDLPGLESCRPERFLFRDAGATTSQSG